MRLKVDLIYEEMCWICNGAEVIGSKDYLR
uniref:Uncharacterized protein n=1 Tax=Anguilla anguilla TaxID=7936 RepID=A0A0E9UF80_ANGAN